MRFLLRLMTVMAAAFGGMAGTVLAVDPPPAALADVSAVALTALPEKIAPLSALRPSSIPEPVSLAVFGTGILLVLRRRRS